MTIALLLGGGILLSGLLGAFNVQIIPNFNFAGFEVNWFTAICLILLFYVAIRYIPMGFKRYVVCGVCLVLGVFCSFDLYREMTKESYIRGSINIQNQFTMESFNYVSTSLVLYNDIYDTTDTWTYEIELDPVVDFNGQRNDYQLVINDYLLFGTIINAGSVDAVFNMDFYDTNGTMICSATMDISIKFYSNKTALSFAVVGSQSASFLEQYFADNGIRLYVNQIKGGS